MTTAHGDLPVPDRIIDAAVSSCLPSPQVQSFCQECLKCKGVLCFTGVGKSGFIAQKITQTLVSTGTKAVFLSPTDALHGDIGIIGPDDLLVCFSKSGGTEELLKLLPYAKVRSPMPCSPRHSRSHWPLLPLPLTPIRPRSSLPTAGKGRKARLNRLHSVSPQPLPFLLAVLAGG